MRRWRCALAALTIALGGWVNSDAQSSGSAPLLWFDVYRFPETDSTCIVELAYSIERNSLRFQNAGGYWVAGAEIENRFYRGDSLIFQTRFLVEDTVGSKDQVRGGQKLLEFRRYRFRPGRYGIVVTLKDRHTGQTRTLTDTVEVAGRRTKELVASDLILASSVRRAPSPTSGYWRNGLEVVPNASRVYGKGLESLGFYAEVYGLRRRADGASCYWMAVRVSDEFGRSPVRYAGKSHLIQGTACAVHGTVDVSSLERGGYLLTVTVHDCVTGDSVQLSRHFFVVRPGTPVASASESESGRSLASEYANMPEAKLDSLYELIKYIASRDEQEIYPRLDLGGKRRFMTSFWLRRDPDPSTPENEARRDYFRRVEYANVHFSYGRAPGWKTDRGRVLLQYGWPDQVDRHVGEMIENPYEVWTYEKVQGGVEFIFVDRRRVGNYELVYSTAVGEIREEQWMRYLYR